MNDRKKALLGQIIKEHIKSAEPVGSKLLENKSRLGVSSATIRNEMAELENEGYIVQPYTSAGRIPTEKGYLYYLDNFIKANGLSQKDQQEIQTILKNINRQSLEIQIKNLAKKVAELSNNAVITAFSDNNFYYTGLSNLFSQPEFQNTEVIYDFSLIMDSLDQVIARIYGEIKEVTVKIGSHNPFGETCSLIVGPWQISRQRGLMAILGPIRMDYQKNLGLINYIKENI